MDLNIFIDIKFFLENLLQMWEGVFLNYFITIKTEGEIYIPEIPHGCMIFIFLFLVYEQKTWAFSFFHFFEFYVMIQLFL